MSDKITDTSQRRGWRKRIEINDKKNVERPVDGLKHSGMAAYQFV